MNPNDDEAMPMRLDEHDELLFSAHDREQCGLHRSNLGHWSLDTEGAMEWDTQACSLFGFQGDSVPDSLVDFLFYIREDCHESLLDALNQARFREEVFEQTVELEVALGGSEKLRMVGIYRPGPDSDGAVLCGLCYQERGSDREAGLLPASEGAGLEAYRQFYLISSDCFAEVGSGGYLTRLNPAWSRILGYMESELLARPYLDFIHPGDLASTRQLFAKLEAAEEATLVPAAFGEFENRIRSKDGSYRWFTWVTQLMQDRILIVAKDITEAKTAGGELAQTISEMRDSNQELQSFASVASHDLREPLRMITSYLRLLIERSPEALDARGRRYIEYACAGADRMRSMIEDLLSYARLGSAPRSLEPIGLDDIFEEVIENLSVLIKSAGAEVTVDIDNSPVVEGDRTGLVRLFQNLLSNAIKFQPEGAVPRVEVKFAQQNTGVGGRQCIVSIRDNGIGVDEDHGELLFNVFQRLNTRDEFEGSGIGLAVCKRIIEQHGGRIWLDSEPGKGSTFYVSISQVSDV